MNMSTINRRFDHFLPRRAFISSWLFWILNRWLWGYQTFSTRRISPDLMMPIFFFIDNQINDIINVILYFFIIMYCVIILLFSFTWYLWSLFFPCTTWPPDVVCLLCGRCYTFTEDTCLLMCPHRHLPGSQYCVNRHKFVDKNVILM